MLTTEERRKGLGATDVAAIVGVSPYRSPIEVYREKLGLEEPFEMSERMRWGQLLQDAVKQGYEEQTGRRLFERAAPLRHKTHRILYGHPDYYVYGEPGLLEVKTAVSRRGWDEDSAPAHVRVQCQWYLGLSGRAWCDIALLSSTSTLTVIRIAHDPELYEALVLAAVRFWRDHVETRVEPPPDASEAYRRHLAEKFPRSSDIQLIATPEQVLLIDELRAADAAEKAAKRHVDELENRIRAAMADAAELISPDGRITYRTEKPRVRWQEVAETIAVDTGAVVAEYAARDMEGRDGPRVLRKHFPKTEEEGAAA